MPHALFIFPVVVRFVYIFVEKGEPDEERQAYEVFHPLYILVIINQREYFFYMTDWWKKVWHFHTPALAHDGVMAAVVSETTPIVVWEVAHYNRHLPRLTFPIRLSCQCIWSQVVLTELPLRTNVSRLAYRFSGGGWRKTQSGCLPLPVLHALNKVILFAPLPMEKCIIKSK